MIKYIGLLTIVFILCSLLTFYEVTMIERFFAFTTMKKKKLKKEMLSCYQTCNTCFSKELKLQGSQFNVSEVTQNLSVILFTLLLENITLHTKILLKLYIVPREVCLYFGFLVNR